MSSFHYRVHIAQPDHPSQLLVQLAISEMRPVWNDRLNAQSVQVVNTVQV